MFCTECGTKSLEGADFCQKCGAKRVRTDTRQPASETTTPEITSAPMQPQSHTTNIPPAMTAPLNDTVELVVTIVCISGLTPRGKFDVFVDDVKTGELSFGASSTYKIAPGQHCIKIGRPGLSPSRIGIDVPEGSAPVALSWQWEHWDAGVTREIVCHQSHLVTTPSETEKANIINMVGNLNTVGKIGFGCIVLGALGAIVGVLSIETLEGPIVSAYQHATLDNTISYGLCIGGLVLVIIGAFTMQLSSRKKKK